LNLSSLKNRLRELRTYIALLIGRGDVTLVDDSGALQTLQIKSELADEPLDGVPHLQPYGFNSVPLAGAKVAVLFPNAAREDGVAVVVASPEHRPRNWQPGEAGLFTDEGVALRLKRGAVLEITQTELRITVDSLTINAGGSILEMDAAGVRITAVAVDIDP